MAFVTVVIPVYKVPFDYLDQCVNSVINQTLKDIEIILVDDGAPNKWLQKCDYYSILDDRLKVLHKPNGGLSEARNFGLKNCNSEWITFLDDDDWFELDFLENFQKYIAEKKELADIYMYSGFRNYPRKQIERVPHYPKGTTFVTKEEKEELQTKCFTNYVAKGGNVKGITINSGCMKIFNVSFLKTNKLLFPNVPYAEDSLFYLISIEKASRVEYVGDSVYHYRNTEGSIVNQYRPNAIQEQQMYLNYIFNFIKEYNKSEDFLDKAYMRVFVSMLLLIKLKFFNEGNPDGYFKRRRECKLLFETEPYKDVFDKLKKYKLTKKATVKLYLLKFKLYGLAEYGRKVKTKNRTVKKTKEINQ